MSTQPIQPQPTFFESIALPLVERLGVPVAPCYPRDKQVHTKLVPSPLTMMSKGVLQILKWGAAEPDANVCVYAEQKEGGLLFLDKDGAISLRSKYEKETGKTFPKTLLVQSSIISDGNGGTITKGHWYFLQTPRTIAMEKNISELSTGGMFSLRVKNEYVASIGSIHPDTGKPYIVVEDYSVLSMPDDLLDWLLKQVVAKKDNSTPSGPRELIKHGQIHSWMLTQAGKLRAMGLDADGIEGPLLALVHANCEPPIDDEKVKTMAKSICNFAPGTPGVALTLGQQVDAAQAAAKASEASKDATGTFPHGDKNMPDPLSEDAYHGLAGRHLRNIEANSEAHPAGILGIFLSGFGSIVGRRAFILVEDSIHFPAVNVLVTGKSSRSRKDTATGRALRPLKEADNVWAKDSIHQSFASGEALTAYFHNRFQKMPPKPIRLFVTDTEFKTTMTICGRQGNTLSEGYRRLFNGDPMENIVKKARLYAPYTCGSVSGAITLGELQETLKQVEIESGFVNRFLTMLIHRVRRISRPNRVTDAAAISERAAIVTELREVLRWVEKHSADIHGVHAGEPLTGISMSWADDAGELWDSFYNGLGDDDAEYLNRAEVFVLRLTMIYALLDKSAVMKVEHVKAALAVWEYAKQSAALVYGSAQSPDVTRLLGKALASGKMTRGSVSNFFGRHKSAEELDWLMEEVVRLSKGQLGLVTGLDKWNKPTIAGIVNKSRQTQETGSGGSVSGGESKAA